ncbi:hypothetical protein ACWGLF_31060 [Streptomyces puniciscabiei]
MSDALGDPRLDQSHAWLWVWPGTQLTIGLPGPEQIRGRAGDLLLAHYLLGHNVGGNHESERTRRALYFRISALDHASR